LQSNFLEGNKGESRLEEDNPDAFEVFVQWLYLGRYRFGNKERLGIGYGRGRLRAQKSDNGETG
jgi:hypothetical protein